MITQPLSTENPSRQSAHKKGPASANSLGRTKNADCSKQVPPAQSSDGTVIHFPDAETRLIFFAAMGVASFDSEFDGSLANIVARNFFEAARKEREG